MKVVLLGFVLRWLIKLDVRVDIILVVLVMDMKLKRLKVLEQKFQNSVKTKNFLFYAVFTILAFTFLFTTPYIQVKVSEIIGWDITRGGYFNAFSNNKEKLTRLFWYAIAGLEEPIFPNFFCVSLGCILGYRLTQPNVNKKLARRWSLVALGLMIMGLQ